MLAAFITALPALALAAGFGSISGVITEASSGNPIQGMAACAFALHGELLSEEEREHAFGCTETNATGAYTISELVPESYAVVFFDGPSSTLNFIPQIYDNTLPSAEPTPVPVTAGNTTPNIDAKMLPGARISGRVTAALTGAPIERAIVIGFQRSGEGEFGVVARTNAAGEYVLGGLSTGAYDVAFIAKGYEEQFFDHKTSRAEATAVSVTVPETTPGINASLVVATEPPPGSEGLGSEGPTSGRSGAPESQLPGGVGSQKPHPEGRLSLLGRTIRVRSRGRARIELRCAGHAACNAKVTLRLRRIADVRGHAKSISVALGTSSVLSIAGSRKRAVTVSLNALGRTLLRASGSILHAELEIVTPGHHRDERVLLSAGTARATRSDPRFTG